MDGTEESPVDDIIDGSGVSPTAGLVVGVSVGEKEGDEESTTVGSGV